jgi:hypothetical protein
MKSYGNPSLAEKQLCLRQTTKFCFNFSKVDGESCFLLIAEVCRLETRA